MTFAAVVHSLPACNQMLKLCMCRSAEDVSVKDTYPVNATFRLVEGTLARSLGSIEAGRTVEFQYVMIPTGGQRSIECPAAEVTYSSAPGLPVSVLRSTTQALDVLSKAQHFEQILVSVVRSTRCRVVPHSCSRAACPGPSQKAMVACCMCSKMSSMAAEQTAPVQTIDCQGLLICTMTCSRAVSLQRGSQLQCFSLM